MAWISEVRPLALVAGTGRRAAFTGPKGADIGFIPGVKSLAFRREGGFGESSCAGVGSGGTSSVVVIGGGEGLSVVGSSMFL